MLNLGQILQRDEAALLHSGAHITKEGSFAFLQSETRANTKWGR